MYHRKIKLIGGKKKPKAPNSTGSNWGPRLALYEREKALAQVGPNPNHVHKSQQQHPTHIRQQNPYFTSEGKSNKLYPRNDNLILDEQQNDQKLNYKKVSISTCSSSHDGSSSANHYIYNYSRKASTSASSETSKSFIVPSSSSLSERTSRNDNSKCNSNVDGGGSTYILGSNTGSHVTLSGSTVGDTMSQPLTLIIPQSDTLSRFDSDFEETRYNVLDRSQDSFPSTRTYQSSGDDEQDEEDNEHPDKHSIATNNFMRFRRKTTTTSNNSFPAPINPAIITNLGILKVSTTKPLIHQEESSAHIRQYQLSLSTPIISTAEINKQVVDKPQQHQDATESNNLNNGENKKQLKSPEMSTLKNIAIALCNDSNKNNSTGSTISSLAHGIKMMYVPMESLPRSKSAAVLNASLEYDPVLSALIKENSNDVSPITLEEFPLPANKDPDNDSLLESFDSIMFKPREEQQQNERVIGSSPKSSSSASSTPTKGSPNTYIFNVQADPKIVENSEKNRRQTCCSIKSNIPPPLPPKNQPPPLVVPKKVKQNVPERKNETRKKNTQFFVVDTNRDENIRVAVENLENIINPKSVIMTNVSKKEGKSSSKLKKVTLTLPGMQNELMLNLGNETDTADEIDAYSSSFLTCGHVLKDDDYSTISSTHSSPHRISDQDDDEAYEDQCNSQGEQSPEAKENQRSVLQQLRELSILIGGGNYAENDKIFTDIRNNKDPSHIPNPISKSFRLHEENPNNNRKISDATDNSADSGKGSGSGSGSSPKSIHSSPDSTTQLTQNVKSSADKCSAGCAFRSDCNECLMYNKPANGFQKPENSEELCNNAELHEVATSTPRQLTNSIKKSTKILRRKSSKLSKSSSSTKSSSKSSSSKKKKPLILDYCECSSCDAAQEFIQRPGSKLQKSKSKDIFKSTYENARKISTGSSSSGSSSVKLSRSVAFRNSSRSSSKSKSSPISITDQSTNGLFTIEEIEESPSIESKARNNSSNYNEPQVAKFIVANNHANSEIHGSNNCVVDADIRVSNGSPHWHPNCWLAADPMLGWSDMESLYSLNVKNDKPLSINGECWTCWQEISDIKRNSENPNGTVDRTKRMFIWLNKRHKEFQAPWWEAKKQASIRWVMTKALAHVPKEYLMDPFKESKKGKPTKYRLREEVIAGLVSGKLYSCIVANLYHTTLGGGTGYSANGLSHWDIIKILSRRGVYVAQPSDMKLTEGTLRQKPIRIAAHIALIESIMSLYSKEILARERIVSTLHTLGSTIKPETTSPEKLVVAWINASVMTLKTYIMSTRNHNLSPEKQNRWLQLPQVGEIRDLCEGWGILCLFAMYCSNDLKVSEISLPDPGETLTIYDSISNHSLCQKLCEELLPETIYHLCVTDFLYIHGYMKQNILCFLVDLFIHLEVNPIVRVNRLTHVPIRLELS